MMCFCAPDAVRACSDSAYLLLLVQKNCCPKVVWHHLPACLLVCTYDELFKKKQMNQECRIRENVSKNIHLCVLPSTAMKSTLLCLPRGHLGMAVADGKVSSSLTAVMAPFAAASLEVVVASANLPPEL